MAIVESKDGQITYVEPYKIKFIDTEGATQT